MMGAALVFFFIVPSLSAAPTTWERSRPASSTRM
jgi:hypothetical protein